MPIKAFDFWLYFFTFPLHIHGKKIKRCCQQFRTDDEDIMMKNRHLISAQGAALALILSPPVVADLADPRTRDENLSATTVDVVVNMEASGLYVYTYSVSAGSANTGKVSEFAVDISCEDVPDSKGFSPSDFPTRSLASASSDNKHVPVALDSPEGQSFQTGVAASNEAMWSVMLKPGEMSTGLKIVSPYPPGARDYALYPSVDYNMQSYDYEGLDPEDPTVPWIDDWTVRGVTTGPACPGEEYPPGGDGGIFKGSFESSESAETNALLTYSAPLIDQIALEAGTGSIEIIIHYGSDIDAKTFRVTPERNKLKSLFTPRAGSSEAVVIPLNEGKNRIEFKVHAKSMPGEQNHHDDESPKKAGLILDRDVFVFRVPAISDRDVQK